MPETTAPPLTTREIADRYRRDVNTVNGWINDGVFTRAGVRVHLRATKVGGTWNVQPEDLLAFLRALNPEAAVDLARQQDDGAAEGREAAARMKKRLGLK
jgi:hypothetical protein